MNHLILQANETKARLALLDAELTRLRGLEQWENASIVAMRISELLQDLHGFEKEILAWEEKGGEEEQ